MNVTRWLVAALAALADDAFAENQPKIGCFIIDHLFYIFDRANALNGCKAAEGDPSPDDVKGDFSCLPT